MQNMMLSGTDLHALFTVGYRNLKKNMEAVNNLNVFPVPDGDTGTNMVQTFGGGLRAVHGDIPHAGEYMQKLAKATLLSARGNSGVIFSQFVHGLARGFADKAQVCFADFAHAFNCAREDAYKAILTPTEGTILTVIREGAEFLQDTAGSFDDPQEGFRALLSQMKVTLAHTPEMLPVLKEAGVVDSGGAGLVCFTEGMLAQLSGEDIEDTPDILDTIASTHVDASDFGPDSILEYGYCTEFILQLMNYKTDIANFDQDGFIAELEKLGDSIVCVKSDSIVKIHVHTFTPEEVLAYARRFGEFVTIKIENMSVQHSEAAVSVPQKPQKHQTYAIVATASGKGIADYFREIGTDVIVDGGQTQNPAAEDFINAFKQVDADYIVVLPNNSNIVMAAKQAAQLYTDADVRVISTRSIAEGYSALSMMDTSADTVEELIEGMSAGLGGVSTGYVTTATRDTVMNGVTVQKGKYIGLDRENILCCCEDKLTAAMEMLKNLPNIAEKQTIIVFTGKDVTADEADTLAAAIGDTFPMCDVGFIEGGQDVYSFIMSIE